MRGSPWQRTGRTSPKTESREQEPGQKYRSTCCIFVNEILPKNVKSNTCGGWNSVLFLLFGPLDPMLAVSHFVRVQDSQDVDGVVDVEVSHVESFENVILLFLFVNTAQFMTYEKKLAHATFFFNTGVGGSYFITVLSVLRA